MVDTVNNEHLLFVFGFVFYGTYTDRKVTSDVIIKWPTFEMFLIEPESVVSPEMTEIFNSLSS